MITIPPTAIPRPPVHRVVNGRVEDVATSDLEGAPVRDRTWIGAVLLFVFGGALVLLAALAGCVTVTVPLPDGRTASYTRVGSTKIDGLVVRTPDGYHVEVQGYGSEGAGLVEAAVRGAVQGVRP